MGEREDRGSRVRGIDGAGIDGGQGSSSPSGPVSPVARSRGSGGTGRQASRGSGQGDDYSPPSTGSVFAWMDPPPVRKGQPRRYHDWTHTLTVLSLKPGAWARVASVPSPSDASELSKYLRRRYHVESVSRGGDVYARWIDGTSTNRRGEKREAHRRQLTDRSSRADLQQQRDHYLYGTPP